VTRPDLSFAAVKVGTKTIKEEGPDGNTVSRKVEIREEIQYAPPSYTEPIPTALKEFAEEIVNRYRDVMNELRPFLGNTTPVDPEYDAAVAILKADRDAAISRKPFLDAHGGNSAVSDKRLKELRDE
jgi:hypothetical protein